MLGIVCHMIFLLMIKFSHVFAVWLYTEQNLMTKVIYSKPQQINILTYLNNSLFSDTVVTEMIY